MTEITDEEVFSKNDFRCVYCDFDGRTFDGWKHLIVDHFKPKKRGGSNDLENLVTACDVCNMMKGPWKEWPTLDEARTDMLKWHGQMRQYWEKNVRPLL